MSVFVLWISLILCPLFMVGCSVLVWLSSLCLLLLFIKKWVFVEMSIC